MKRRLLCVVTVLAVVGFAPAPLPRKDRAGERASLESLQGTWRMTLNEGNGQPISHSFVAQVKGEQWTFVGTGDQMGSNYPYYLTLNRSVSPRALEWAYDKDRQAGFVGSYRVQGKTLTVVYTPGTLKDLDKRPTNFDGPVPFRMVFEYVGRE